MPVLKGQRVSLARDHFTGQTTILVFNVNHNRATFFTCSHSHKPIKSSVKFQCECESVGLLVIPWLEVSLEFIKKLLNNV